MSGIAMSLTMASKDMPRASSAASRAVVGDLNREAGRRQDAREAADDGRLVVDEQHQSPTAVGIWSLATVPDPLQLGQSHS